jgi:[NiFe] hydrogenase assembly HybE family chaperone
MLARPDFVDRLNRRAAELAALFVTIESTRMACVPVLNPALRVEVLGFEVMARDEDEAAMGLGILITPWFMNLVRLPLAREADDSAVGRKQIHAIRGQSFEFIGAHEPAIGAFAACSLFSPMFEFAGQAAARATALAVLKQLRSIPQPAVAVPAATLSVEPPPERRAFLFGRSAAGAAPR